ncbi:MAG: glycoside hydrolase family 5 protein [Marinoscillum sp.]|uniref:glycoside hydrolase family 5 protein n=1 Tax=Marinoscillum sp. TaxID=2024838 RepID=UPI0032FD30E1
MKLLVCSLLLIVNTAVAQHSLERITVSGNQFVSESGKKVVLRGYNSSDPDNLEKQGQWGQAYFQEMKAWGSNVVRFPIHPRAWRERGESAYLELLDSGIHWAAEQGMYVILDWHSIGNLKSELFFRPGYETTLKETFSFWQTMARKYGDNPTVAFYELFNEPTTNNGQLGVCFWEEWKSINEEMITIIRACGGKGIPLVAGFNWAYDLSAAFERPIEAVGIGYVSHPYPQKRNQPWEGQWTQDWGRMKEKYPVILTEIGFSGAEERGAHVPVISDESYGEAITKYCDEKDISYVVWVFDARWAPSLFRDWEFQELTRHGKYFKAKLNTYQYD